MPAPVPKLFQPVKVGKLELKHRIVMAPLTRYRADDEHVHTDMGLEYYSQRASTPGTLLITEGSFIANKAGGNGNVPNLETDAQLAAWKKITDAVHAKGSFIFAQLWALGRQADPKFVVQEGNEYVSASAIPLADVGVTPKALSTEEAKEYVQLFATAAANAVNKAGFDGVEIHGANGYLVDQFIQDMSNTRTDEYGGSIENRAKFALEIVDAVAKAVGADKTGIRLSPWGLYGDMRMKDPKPQFSYVVQKIKENQPNLAYIHLVEPRVNGNYDRPVEEGETNDFLREIWKPRPFLSAGGYDRELGLEVAEKGDIAVFGRHFIANPDLPLRFKKNIPLTPYDRDTFYAAKTAKGYTDYPFADIPAEEGNPKRKSFFSKMKKWVS